MADSDPKNPLSGFELWKLKIKVDPAQMLQPSVRGWNIFRYEFEFVEGVLLKLRWVRFGLESKWKMLPGSEWKCLGSATNGTDKKWMNLFVSVAEPPLFWEAPASEVSEPTPAPTKLGGLRLQTAPAPYTKISHFVPLKISFLIWYKSFFGLYLTFINCF